MSIRKADISVAQHDRASRNWNKILITPMYENGAVSVCVYDDQLYKNNRDNWVDFFYTEMVIDQNKT